MVAFHVIAATRASQQTRIHRSCHQSRRHGGLWWA